MDCPQCAAEVPADNAFCGKCGYAMRDEGLGRTDQSRIRLHEEPTPTTDDRPSRPSSPRIRKHTVLGMPPASRRASAPDAPSEPPPPPPSISAARAERRSAQKTMLGIPQPDLPSPPPFASTEGDEDVPDVAESDPPGGRPRAHVQYNSVFEALPATQRRRSLFIVGAVLVALSAGWLIYRFVNG